MTLEIPSVIPGDWNRLRVTVDKLKHLHLGRDSSPTFVGLTLTGLTASRLIWTDANKALASKDLVDLVAGTTNQITVTDDGDGSITLSTPQNIHTGAGPTFDTLTLSSIAAEGTDVDKFLVDSSGLIKYRTGAQVLSDIGASASAHLHDGATLEHDNVDSDGGAFSFSTTGTVTFNQSVASANYGATNKLTACATNAGELDFTAGSKKLDVEDNAVVSQDYSSDASPQFTGIELGHASDTTFTRISAGVVAIEGTNIAMVGGAHHDRFSDFVANEHIDHTNITLTAGTGLTGGGDISSNRTFAVDGVLEDLDTLGANSADSEFLVGTVAGALAWESGTTVRTSIGLGTGDSPTFAGLSIGTGELTCGSINRASGTLTIEIGGTAEISITSTTVTLGGNLIIPDTGYIGSVSDTDAIQIEADGDILISQDLGLGISPLTRTHIYTDTTSAVGRVVLQASNWNTATTGHYLDWTNGWTGSAAAGDVTARIAVTQDGGNSSIFAISTWGTLPSIGLNERVRINSVGDFGIRCTPSIDLDVRGHANEHPGIYLTAVTNAYNPHLRLVGNSSTYDAEWGFDDDGDSGAGLIYIGRTSIVPGIFNLGLGSNNVGFGVSAWGTNAARVWAMVNGTAPTTSPADCFQIYSTDFNAEAGKACIHIRTEDGAVVRLNQDVSTLAIPTLAGLSVSGATHTTLMKIEHTGPSGNERGGGILLYANDGAALASGDRTGFVLCGGYNGAASKYAAGITSFTEALWSGSVSSADLRFETTETNTRSVKARITGAGDFGIGIAPSSIIHAMRSGGNCDVILEEYQGNEFGNYIGFKKARGTLGTPAALQDDDNIAKIIFYGHDGTNFVAAGSVACWIDGTVGTGDVPTEMQFNLFSQGGSLGLRLLLTGDDNLGLNQSSFGTNAVGIFALGSGTAPASSPANCFQMYSADIAGGHAAPHIRNENGTIVKLYQQAHIADATTQDLAGGDTIDETKLESDLANIVAAVNALILASETDGRLAVA